MFREKSVPGGCLHQTVISRKENYTLLLTQNMTKHTTGGDLVKFIIVQISCSCRFK